MKIIDATDLILGRMAGYAAKLALNGEKVAVVNCEKAVISGSKKDVMEKMNMRRNIGDPFHGPYYPRMPDRLVRRAIRGMLPWAKPRGREAFRRVMCYIGVPREFENNEMETIKSANKTKLKIGKFISVSEVTKEMGWKSN